MNTEFKITQGEWIITYDNETIIDEEGYSIFPCGAVNLPFMENNVKLAVDAGNTFNQCNLLPSELLKQNKEMREMLEEILINSRHSEDVCFVPTYMEEQIEQFLNPKN